MANCRHAGGGCENPEFYTPHDIWVDSQVDVYVAEVTILARGKRDFVLSDFHTVKKFVHET